MDVPTGPAPDYFKFSSMRNVPGYDMSRCFVVGLPEWRARTLSLFQTDRWREAAAVALDEQLVYPSSQYDHHQGEHGLLYHVFHCIELALAKVSVGPCEKRDRLLFSIIAHDWGKVDVYRERKGFEELAKHQYMSAEKVRKLVGEEVDVIRNVAEHHSRGMGNTSVVSQVDRESARIYERDVVDRTIKEFFEGVMTRNNRIIHVYETVRARFNLLPFHRFTWFMRKSFQNSPMYFEVSALNVLSMLDERDNLTIEERREAHRLAKAKESSLSPADVIRKRQLKEKEDEKKLTVLGGHTPREINRKVRGILTPYVHHRMPAWAYVVPVGIDGKIGWFLPLNSDIQMRGQQLRAETVTIYWFGSGSGFRQDSIGDFHSESGDKISAQTIDQFLLGSLAEPAKEVAATEGKAQKSPSDAAREAKVFAFMDGKSSQSHGKEGGQPAPPTHDR